MAVGSNTLGLIFRIGADIGDTQTKLKAVTDQLKVGADAAKGSVSDLGSQFKILSGFVEGFVAGGLTAFVQGVIKAATETADWVNELDRASQATSIEIRTLAQLEGAFKEAGGSLNSMIGTFDIFAIHLEQAREGNNKFIDVLEKYGIVSGDITEATDQAFRALGQMTDQTEKARLAQELFGRGGARQILQFKDLKDGIKGVTAEYKGLGDAIDPKLVESARAYEAESKRLDAALVANRAVIAGLILPAWVDFNASIRKAMESLSNYKSLVEHTNEALDKFKIGPGLPKAPERGLEGEVVLESEARRSTEEGIAARSLEAARRVKDEKIKIAKQTTAGVSDADRELARAQQELLDQQQQTGDTIIENMEDQLKGLNQAIAATFDIQALVKWKFAIFDFAQVLHDQTEGIVRDLAKIGGAVPGGGGVGGIPGAPPAIPLPAPATGGFFEDLHNSLGQSINEFQTWGDIVGGILGQFAQATEQAFAAFILTGKLSGQIFKQLVAQIIASVAIESAVKAIFQLAEGFAALAAGDPYSAAMHFTSAKIYGVVAAVAGAVGLGIGASGGLGGDAAGAAGGGFGGTAAPTPVTINQGAGGPLGVQLQQLHALNNISNKLDTASPGDVLVRGAEQNPVAIGQANNEASRRDGSISREFLQISGLRTA
jgi:hypothetical protein